MLGGVGGCRLRARIAKTDVAIGDFGLQGFGAGLRHGGDAVLGDTAENLHELPIAVGVVLEARG